MIRVWATDESSKLKKILLQRPNNLPSICDALVNVPNSWGSIPNAERLLEEHDLLREKLESLGVSVVMHEVPEDSPLFDAMFVRDIAKVVAGNLVLCRPKSWHRQPEAELFRAQWKGGIFVEASEPVEGADVLIRGGDVYISVGDRTSPFGAAMFKRVYVGRKFNITTKNGPSVPQHLLGGHRMLGNLLFQRTDVEPILWKGDVILVEPDNEVRENLAMNWIALSSKSVLMPDRCPKMKSLLESNGIEVHTSPMSEISKLQGGFACGSLPLERERT